MKAAAGNGRWWLPMLWLCAGWPLLGATCIQTINRPPLPPEVSLQEAVAVVNSQSAPLQTVESSNARVTVTLGSMTFPSLKTRIAAAKPRHFRLMSSILGSEQIDIGSNEQLFWFWVRQNQPPGIYYANHQEYAQSVLRQQLPIDPEWLMESMGWQVFRPEDQPQSVKPIGQGRLEIHALRQTPSGMQHKLTRIDATMGWVLEQYLLDSRGEVVASAVCRQPSPDPLTGSVVPHEVTMSWPALDLKFQVSLNDVRLNELRDPGGDLWAMPEMPGFPPQDLSRMQLTPPAE